MPQSGYDVFFSGTARELIIDVFYFEGAEVESESGFQVERYTSRKYVINMHYEPELQFGSDEDLDRVVELRLICAPDQDLGTLIYLELTPYIIFRDDSEEEDRVRRDLADELNGHIFRVCHAIVMN